MSDDNSASNSRSSVDHNENSTKQRISTMLKAKFAAEDNKSPEKCAICLCAPENRSFADNCGHEFCFVCLLEWSKVKAECPLCKQKMTNIVRNVRSHEEFEQFEVKPPVLNNSDDLGRRMRPIMGFERLELLRHIRQMQMQLVEHRRGLGINRVSDVDRLQRLRDLFDGSAESREFLTSSVDFRRMIYERGLRVRDDVTDNRRREASPDFFRENPAVIHRLVPWLTRELSALLDGDHDRIRLALDRICSLIVQHEINSEEFKRRMSVIFGQNTEHFVHEFYHFARSPFEMDEYDRRAEYERVAATNGAVENAELVTLSPSPPPVSGDGIPNSNGAAHTLNYGHEGLFGYSFNLSNPLLTSDFRRRFEAVRANFEMWRQTFYIDQPPPPPPPPPQLRHNYHSVSYLDYLDNSSRESIVQSPLSDYANRHRRWPPRRTRVSASLFQPLNLQTNGSWATTHQNGRSSPIFAVSTSSDSSRSNSPVVVGGAGVYDDQSSPVLFSPIHNNRGIDNESHHSTVVSSERSATPFFVSSPAPLHSDSPLISPGRFSTPPNPFIDVDGFVDEPDDEEYTRRQRRRAASDSKESEADDIEIVAVLKPKFLRTPEVISLDDDSFTTKHKIEENGEDKDEDKPGSSGYVPPRTATTIKGNNYSQKNSRSRTRSRSPSRRRISSGSDDEEVEHRRRVYFDSNRLKSVIINPNVSTIRRLVISPFSTGSNRSSDRHSSSKRETKRSGDEERHSTGRIIVSDASECSKSSKSSTKKHKHREHKHKRKRHRHDSEDREDSYRRRRREKHD